MQSCKHNYVKLCADCAKLIPYMIFNWNEGYVWGPGNPSKTGQKIIFKR